MQHATLRLFSYDGSPDGGSVYSVSNSQLNGSTLWTETNLTWNNAPAIAGIALDTAGSVSTNTWVDFDVTAAVQSNGTFSFGLKSGSSNSAYFRSKEYASTSQC